MKKYKTYLFDLDGTLLDFALAEQKAIPTLFRQHHLEFHEEILKKYHEINLSLWKNYEQGKIQREEIFQQRFPRLFKWMQVDIDGLEFEKEYRAILNQSHDLIDHAMEVVQTLSQHHNLYITSNGTSFTQNERLKLSHLAPYFKKVFVSEETGSQKPFKQFFDYCFERIENFDLSNCIIIGDSLTADIAGGIQSQIDTCWFNPKYLENTTEFIPMYEIHDLRELLDIEDKGQ